MGTSLIQPPAGTPLIKGHPLCQDLLACYPLNEGGGLTAFNKYGTQAVNGTLTGTGAKFKSTQRGNAFVADGTATYIDCTNNNYLMPTTAISISAWINLNNFTSTYSTIVAKAAGTNPYLLSVKSTGKLAMYIQATASVNYDGTGINTLVAGKWYHLVLTYSVQAGLSGYLNGRLDGTAAANGNITTGTGIVCIGQDTGNASRFANGYIQNVMIWKRALPYTQVVQLFNNPYSMYQQKVKKV